MRVFFMLVFTFFFYNVYAQEIEVVELLPPESFSYEDLGFLKEELAAKNVVMLGELTHMYGNIFETKARLVEYLHQKLGYTTFAIEAPMYDIWKMNQKGFNAVEFNNAIWGVWSSSSEFQRLVTYIEKNNLRVIGFDSQIIDIDSFILDFFDYCKDEKIRFKTDEDDFAIVLEGVLEHHKIDESDMKFSTFESEIKRVIVQLEKGARSSTNWYWIQFVKGILASAQDAYYNKDIEPTSDLAMPLYNIRDKQMADNLLQYVALHPKEKLICWGDNVHMMYSNPNSGNSAARSFVSMGSHVKKALKDQVYSLGTLHANDSIYDRTVDIWYDTTVLKGSFEDKLLGFNHPNIFVSSSQLALQKSMETRLLHFVEFSKERLDSFHDGYIFLSKATLPKKETFEIQIANLRKERVEKSMFQNPKEIENGVFKGKVVDETSGEAIAYATVLIRSKNIYRVTDEEGNYDLPLKELQNKDAIVDIQIMGYDELEIKGTTLQATTYLIPNFEELPEIVLKAYLSPIQVLKKSIQMLSINYPVAPYNSSNYYAVKNTRNDESLIDVEFLTKEFSRGYQNLKGETSRLEQIKWNTDKNAKRYISIYEFFPLRMNAVRYSNVLHKRKYKKFNLRFIETKEDSFDSMYVIYFETDLERWGFTNKGYPTKYSGRIYIDKENYAVLKVVENWESTLKREEIKKYFKRDPSVEKITSLTAKEENINSYGKIGNDDRYYRTEYRYRKYLKYEEKDGSIKEDVSVVENSLSDVVTEQVEELPFEWRGLTPINNTALDRVSYDSEFWKNFYDMYPTKKN